MQIGDKVLVTMPEDQTLKAVFNGESRFGMLFHSTHVLTPTPSSGQASWKALPGTGRIFLPMRKIVMIQILDDEPAQIEAAAVVDEETP